MSRDTATVDDNRTAASVRGYLAVHPDLPVRYDDGTHVWNTIACRGLWTWYVLIDHADTDAVCVQAVQLYVWGSRHHRLVADPVVIDGPQLASQAAADLFGCRLDTAVREAISLLNTARDGNA